MRLRARLWSCLAPLLLLTLTANGQTTTKTKVVLTTISGKVTYKDKPAQGVTVMMRRSEAFTNQYEDLPRAKTGDDGTYQLVNVPPGSFDVSPSAPAYISSGGGRGRTVVVGEGEVIENINFSLVKGGVVTGKVIDADGRPVIAQQVGLFRADAWDQREKQLQQQQQRSSSAPRPNPIFQSGSAVTDDRGIYRMFGLQPGKYKVGVGRGEETFNTSIGSGQRAFRQVFHPDVTDQAKATIIEVSEGSEATGIDVILGRPVQTFTASGQVVDGESGAPVPGLRFAVQRLRADRPEFVNFFAVSNNEGKFVSEGLFAGKYSFTLMAEQNAELRAEAITFDVIDQDVTGLTIKIIKGTSISGVVVLENENPAAIAQLAKARLYAFVPNPNVMGGMGQSATAAINADGTFRAAGLPVGTAFINISNATGDGSRPAAFFVIRLERDGVVQPSGIELREGEQVTGVKVVVSLGTATIRGTIKANVELSESANFSVRINRNGEQFTGVVPPRVDSRGRFAIEGLPPGQYEISAFVLTPNMRPRTPATQQLNVVDGSVNNIELTVELTPVQPRP